MPSSKRLDFTRSRRVAGAEPAGSALPEPDLSRQPAAAFAHYLLDNAAMGGDYQKIPD